MSSEEEDLKEIGNDQLQEADEDEAEAPTQPRAATAIPEGSALLDQLDPAVRDALVERAEAAAASSGSQAEITSGSQAEIKQAVEKKGQQVTSNRDQRKDTAGTPVGDDDDDTEFDPLDIVEERARLARKDLSLSFFTAQAPNDPKGIEKNLQPAVTTQPGALAVAGPGSLSSAAAENEVRGDVESLVVPATNQPGALVVGGPGSLSSAAAENEVTQPGALAVAGPGSLRSAAEVTQPGAVSFGRLGSPHSVAAENEVSDLEYVSVAPETTINEDAERRSTSALSEAFAVNDDDLGLVQTAQEVQQLSMDRQQRCSKTNYIYIGLFAVGCLVLVVSLSIGLTNRKEPNLRADNNEIPVPTISAAGSLPPMENLELLYYNELPKMTRESLYNNQSSQYQAWEWLLNHPNLTSLEEWRKKQIFAMAVFFYSFEGPHWPDEKQSRWLSTTTSECSWVLTDAEAAFWAQRSVELVGNVYEYKDYLPCNEDGELQTIVLSHFDFPKEAEPSFPPEIELLTSLRIVGVIFSRINAKLSNLLVPELMQLSNLVHLNFHGLDATGTLPKEIGLMTSLRHFIIGHNQVTGTIPVEIGRMTSLEQFQINGPSGNLPSQLGQLTSLTRLKIYGSSFDGTMPSELGRLSSIRALLLWNNALTGAIPSELGLLTRTTSLWLGNFWDVTVRGSHNNFSKFLPEELWGLSKLNELYLPNLPNLEGSVPREIMLNLTMLRLEGSPHVSGALPDEICFLQEEPNPHTVIDQGNALEFDCSDLFCGCSCECVGGSFNGTNYDGWQHF